MFDRITHTTTVWTGSPAAVIGSVLIVVVWALTGPIFGFSDTWQLVINTGTTILTFNMVFVIQAAQNRDGAAVQIKLDEILKAIEAADNSMIAIEEEGATRLPMRSSSIARSRRGRDGTSGTTIGRHSDGQAGVILPQGWTGDYLGVLRAGEGKMRRRRG
jgi:low affinity Fe/Cu permease